MRWNTCRGAYVYVYDASGREMCDRNREMGVSWGDIIMVTSHERHGISNHRQLDCLFNSYFCLEALQDLISHFEWCHLGVGPFSILGWARSEPMREDITYVTSSLIGSDRALPQIENEQLSVNGLVKWLIAGETYLLCQHCTTLHVDVRSPLIVWAYVWVITYSLFSKTLIIDTPKLTH